jgi:hypothetical protein
MYLYGTWLLEVSESALWDLIATALGSTQQGHEANQRNKNLKPTNSEFGIM